MGAASGGIQGSGSAWIALHNKMHNECVSGKAQGSREGEEGFYLLLNVVIEIDHTKGDICLPICLPSRMPNLPSVLAE